MSSKTSLPSWTILQNKVNHGYIHNNTKLLPKVPSFIQEFEEKWFNEKKIQIFFDNYWHYSIYISILYIILIFSFKRFMKNRQPYDLRVPLILWSLTLATFSICGAYRFIFGFKLLYENHGVIGTLCATHYYTSVPEGFWTYAFALSKIPELFDTFFIIARKKNLLFLHWYHHTTVLVYSLHITKHRLAGGAYYGCMNMTVHSVMYSYYTLTACKIKLPKKLSILVTTMQTVQMFIGVGVTCFLWTQLNSKTCPTNLNSVLFGSLMYSTYLFLFCKFFVNSYIKKKPSPSNKTKKEL